MLQQRTRGFLSSCTGHWCSSVIAVCSGLFSRCCVQAHLSLWLTVNTLFEARALSTCTVLGFFSSCDLVAPSSCCSHYCSCSVQRATVCCEVDFPMEFNRRRLLSSFGVGQSSSRSGGLLSSCIGQGVSSIVAMCWGGGRVFSRYGVWSPL